MSGGFTPWQPTGLGAVRRGLFGAVIEIEESRLNMVPGALIDASEHKERPR